MVLQVIQKEALIYPDIEIKKALFLKNKFSETSNAKFFIVSQFCFDADTIINWSKRINLEGNKIPIIIGLPGIAKLSNSFKIFFVLWDW